VKIVSWNVNGVRAALKKGLLEFIEKSDADVVCLQETKAHPGDVQHVKWPRGYEMFWNSAEKKGYSGTAVLTRIKPKNVWNGIGAAVHDTEGRVLAVEFPDFWLIDVYQPNSQRGLSRLDYRVKKWDPAFHRYLKKLQSRGKPAIFCGDLNVAHNEIDLTNPKPNRRNAGFTDEERTSFGRLLDGGFLTHSGSSRRARATTRGGARWATAARGMSGGGWTTSSLPRSCVPRSSAPGSAPR
jgi:exodeoxyribonuclease-3